ncbi:arginyltransferase [bacterium]|jgi:arginyl-tRNA--protein-N-Asp/Glu arginylyltransferase|nr:arginyltransferase [bacterium]
MNHLLKECALSEECSYLPGRNQTTHYKIIEKCDIEYNEILIERGWRRFGNMYFRPMCEGCSACESIKIDVNNYAISKSERRIIKKNAHIRTVLRRPSASQAHIELFEKYHDYMHVKRGWDRQPINIKNYYMSFVNGFNEYGYEVLYFDSDRLIAVDLIDILPNGISSIYFYYDPEYTYLSPGKYSMLRQIKYAQANHLDWIYMGYYVKECQSLAYKGDYKPYLTLEGNPKEYEIPTWHKKEPEHP